MLTPPPPPPLKYRHKSSYPENIRFTEKQNPVISIFKILSQIFVGPAPPPPPVPTPMVYEIRLHGKQHLSKSQGWVEDSTPGIYRWNLPVFPGTANKAQVANTGKYNFFAAKYS